ncbi:MAG TPA: hypothetical protein VGG30_08030 [Pirellulales bacterium]
MEPSKLMRRIILGGWTIVFLAWTAGNAALLIGGHAETRLRGAPQGHAPIGQGIVIITAIALFFLARAWWRELRRDHD